MEWREKKVAGTVWNGAKAVWNVVVPSSPRASSSWGGIPSGINYVGNYGGRSYYPQQNYVGANYIRGRNGQPVGYQTYSQTLYYQSAAYRHQVQVQRAQATRMMATVRIKKVCDTADKKWTGRNSGLVVGTAFVIPIPRVPVVPPVTTIPKPDLDTGNFSFPSLPKVPSAQDLANGIVGWALGKYIENIKMEARLDKTADEIIKTEKDAKVRGEFPGEYLDKSLREIEKAAKSGNKQARKAKKLLNDKRFNRGDNRK